MSTDLTSVFASLVTHHVARPGVALPESAGVSWVWAGNGIWKRGVSATMEATILVGAARTPGLANLLPTVNWRDHAGRIPGVLLGALLEDARKAARILEGVIIPVEKQYFIVHNEYPRLIAPRAQRGTVGNVAYAMPQAGTVLVDIHSHHSMSAYWSPTDDRDDQGLSVSCVVGRIFDRPEIVCRINVWGHRQVVPALALFDSLGGFRDGGAYANAGH